MNIKDWIDDPMLFLSSLDENLSEEERSKEMQEYAINVCLKYGGMDDCYYLGLRLLYGIGIEPDLDWAKLFLNTQEKYLHDPKGLSNVYPDIDFHVWGRDIYADKDEIDKAKKELSVTSAAKLALTYLRLFKKTDIDSTINEIFYQQLIGKLGIDEVRKIIVQEHGLSAMNPFYDPQKAYEFLDYITTGGLGTYLKAHCLEKGIGVEKNIEEACKTYCIFASLDRDNPYRRNAIYKVLELRNVTKLDEVPELVEPFENAREDFDEALEAGYSGEDITEIMYTGEEYPNRLKDMSSYYGYFESTTAKYIVLTKYCPVINESSLYCLVSRKKLYDAKKHNHTGECFWYCSMDDVPAHELAIARRLAELDVVNCGTYAGEEWCALVNYANYDDMADYMYESQIYDTELPYERYLCVEFSCPKKRGNNSPKFTDFKTPLEYVQYLLSFEEELIFEKANQLHFGFKTFKGNKERLVLSPMTLDRAYMSDYLSCDDIEIDDDLDDSSGWRYSAAGEEISLEKDSNCDCSFKYCPFKLAAYLKYNHLSDQIKNLECKNKKYDFDIPIDKLDFFCLSDQELENARSLAEEGLVYIKQEQDFPGKSELYIENPLSFSTSAKDWDEFNDIENRPFPIWILGSGLHFSKVNVNDYYGMKILKAATIWSYLIAKDISKDDLRNILTSGLVDAVKTLQNENIDYYYGAIMGDFDTCNLCRSYIKDKLKDEGKKANGIYGLKEITFEEFCNELSNPEDKDFERNFGKIEKSQNKLFIRKSHGEAKKDEERVARLGDHNVAQLTSASNPFDASSKKPSSKIVQPVTASGKTIYVINGLHYRPDKKNIDDVKAFEKAIELLGNIMRRKYVLLCGTRDEVENILKLDERLEWLFRQNVIELTTDGSWEEEFKKFIDSLPEHFLAWHHVPEGELKYKFSRLYKNNKLPFNSSELTVFLRNYCVVNNCLDIPTFSSSDDLEKEWDELIGLTNVKSQMKRIEKLIMYNQRAKMDGRPLISSNRHMMFLGSPGVGKTQVARLMAKKLFSVGAISKEKIVEVDRKDLVGEHIGQTAVKTAEVIKQADGGVLFIDEAYSLCGGENDFGKEAISTLIKAMEDKKDSLIVIFAGYTKEMGEFLKINPGLESRIRFKLVFDDYTTDELVIMFLKKVEKHKLSCKDEDEIKEKVTAIIEKESKQNTFGFGRFIDKLFDETMMNHAVRVLDGSEEDLYVITAEDISLEPETCE